NNAITCNSTYARWNPFLTHDADGRCTLLSKPEPPPCWQATLLKPSRPLPKPNYTPLCPSMLSSDVTHCSNQHSSMFFVSSHPLHNYSFYHTTTFLIL